MTEDIDWESLAKKYQSENESLRIEVWKYRHNPYSMELDFDAISEFVQKNYILILVALIAFSYIGSFFIDLYKARRTM